MDRNRFPGVGMRMVKTAVAVVLCYFIFLPFWLRTPVGEYDPLKDVWPFSACIAAIICMQSSVEQSVRQGCPGSSAPASAERWGWPSSLWMTC